jgi:hypothetical protein
MLVFSGIKKLGKLSNTIYITLKPTIMISFVQLLMIMGLVVIVPIVLSEGVQLFKELFNDAK